MEAKKGTVDRKRRACANCTCTPMRGIDDITSSRRQWPGRMGVRLMAIVAEGERARIYIRSRTTSTSKRLDVTSARCS